MLENNMYNKYTMNVLMSVFIALLFYVLTPGILLSLPSRGSLAMKAATHAVVFAVVYHFTHKAVWKYLNAM
jgi:hypothetical protein